MSRSRSAVSPINRPTIRRWACAREREVAACREKKSSTAYGSYVHAAGKDGTIKHVMSGVRLRNTIVQADVNGNTTADLTIVLTGINPI
jgi:hypothetical protein